MKGEKEHLIYFSLLSIEYVLVLNLKSLKKIGPMIISSRFQAHNILHSCIAIMFTTNQKRWKELEGLIVVVQLASQFLCQNRWPITFAFALAVMLICVFPFLKHSMMLSSETHLFLRAAQVLDRGGTVRCNFCAD